jgi:hypothetical protein
MRARRLSRALRRASCVVRPNPYALYPTRLYPTRLYPTRLYPARFYPTRLCPTRFYPTRLYPTRLYPTCLYPTRLYPTRLYPTRRANCLWSTWCWIMREASWFTAPTTRGYALSICGPPLKALREVGPVVRAKRRSEGRGDRNARGRAGSRRCGCRVRNVRVQGAREDTPGFEVRG